MKIVTLQPGKERSLLRRHPWVFAGSVQHAPHGLKSGETVQVQSADGRFMAWAAFSPSSQIRLRVWSFNEARPIDHAFFKGRVEAAMARRKALPIHSDGVRLIHGEADGLPGLVVDRYSNTLVAQFLSAGTERWKAALADALLDKTGLAELYERSDSSVRKLEGLEPVAGWLRGGSSPDGTPTPTFRSIQEHTWRLGLDIAEGHKTGFYLDQRDNRKAFADAVRHFGHRRVLNCYCYTGGFTVAALAGGASEVVSVDSSGPALLQAEANVALNAAPSVHGAEHAKQRCQFLDADVNQTLRDLARGGETFDAIVLDPPKFAPSAAHASRAARAYKDINRLAFKLLAPGGLLHTYSCSGGISPEFFEKIVTDAALEAGCDAHIWQRLGAAPDHPHTLAFSEGEYLKGLALIKR
jgi:23S rRNA (cytosine1962-C5)-methyltransferase